ncbi:MAG: hypothetical protein SWQ30_21455 [Thermodesulfobacteriota bacterium]|nr:hypothetical protein [Thermodesulfobacteriota bacterium]
MDHKPIARCMANGVEAYEYPFYIKPAEGMEPDYIFLEDHIYNFNKQEKEQLMDRLVRIEQEKDLQGLGYQKNQEGIYILSEAEEPWLDGGQ